MLFNGTPVVIKAVSHPEKLPRVSVDSPITEVAALQLLQQRHGKHHPNVSHLLDCFQDQDCVYLVLPFLSGGDLYSFMEARDGEGVPEDQVARYLHQIASGLLYMKQAGIAHHDLSLENLMFTDSKCKTVKIIDLGMCINVPTAGWPADGYSSPCGGWQPQSPVLVTQHGCYGKPGYVAPEVVREEACDPFASDIWSLGVLLYTMLTGRPLYNSPHDQSFKIMAYGGVKDVVKVYEDCGLRLSPCAKDLICMMLNNKPNKRPTVEDVLRHPFVLSHLVGAHDSAASVG